jgi:para-aminobenzoate synthetase/4-amino-4-deoxychorismate lyase
VVFLNSDGLVTEGAIHNIFVVKSGLWLTPPVTDGVLPGILRQSLLETKTCIERQICIDDLMSADEMYLGNSVRGLRRVRLDFEETLA